MSAHASHPVAVLDADAELAQGLSTRQFDAARAQAVAPVVVVTRGDWQPSRSRHQRDHVGLLVLGGLLTRNVHVLGRTSMELVGTGDLVRPWDDGAEDLSVAQAVTWTVHDPARLAVLDRRFAERVVPWPEISAALIARALRRSRWLELHLAILENPRVDTRLLLFLWHLADRWGQVGTDGVHVPVRLTHQTLGRLVRAQRPTVTRALKQLARRGEASRRTDGSWLLRGEPPR
jgi:CRP/FNR family transcriptional regulator, cyclic AMP receptor protein